MSVTLAEAREIRERRKMAAEELLDLRINEIVEGIAASHEDVSYKEREQLVKLLKHYAKDATPFRTCVRDNMKRFGPGRTEKVCATIKDMIRGTHQWRGDGVSASDDSQEGIGILLSLDEGELETLMMEVTNAASA